MGISVWLRVIRIKFLLASVIAVSLGLSMSYWNAGRLDVVHSVITMAGVISLHASVDLLNDYWDYKRGIDTMTKRTKFSGGTGVLPEGLLKPSHVYWAGVAFLVLGSLAGLYFIVLYGWIIAVILGFAIVSIYFYSTRIVDSGLGEIFVGIKGTMIVLGTYFIQTQQVTQSSVMGGIIVGALSSLVLFITSFPDFDADKQKGRKTLVIMLGKQRAARVFWAFPLVSYGIIVSGVALHLFPLFCLVTFATFPLMIKSGRGLRAHFDDSDRFVPVMKSTLLFSRFTGALFVAGFLVGMISNNS